MESSGAKMNDKGDIEITLNYPGRSVKGILEGSNPFETVIFLHSNVAVSDQKLPVCRAEEATVHQLDSAIKNAAFHEKTVGRPYTMDAIMKIAERDKGWLHSAIVNGMKTVGIEPDGRGK